jgi:hypothetical protein
MLLLCSMVTMTCLTGFFLKSYTGDFVDKVTEKILEAVFALAM